MGLSNRMEFHTACTHGILHNIDAQRPGCSRWLAGSIDEVHWSAARKATPGRSLRIFPKKVRVGSLTLVKGLAGMIVLGADEIALASCDSDGLKTFRANRIDC